MNEANYKDIAADPRPIKSISWGDTYGDGWWMVGHKFADDPITKIVSYEEDGQVGSVPWVAVYVGDKIVARSDCAGATILYE